MSKPVRIDVVSDVVCPWCFIGKRRLEQAVAMTPGIPVEVHFRPYFLNDWIPAEGISREQYLTAKFGSPEAYKDIARASRLPPPAKGSSMRATASIASRTRAIRIASSTGRKRSAKRLR